jgi:hypothetical protein
MGKKLATAVLVLILTTAAASAQNEIDRIPERLRDKANNIMIALHLGDLLKECNRLYPNTPAFQEAMRALMTASLKISRDDFTVEEREIIVNRAKEVSKQLLPQITFNTNAFYDCSGIARDVGTILQQSHNFGTD